MKVDRRTLLGRTWHAMAEVEGFEAGASVFGDDTEPAYFANGTQVAEVVDEQAVGLRLTRKVISAHRSEFKTDARVELQRSDSDWLHVRLRSTRDIPRVVELARLAADAHRPQPGVPAKPPPTGAELARRRRFH